MKMIPKFWRPVFVNNSGQTLTGANGADIILTMSPWKPVSGVKDFGDDIVENFGLVVNVSGTIADAAHVVGASIDDTTTKYWGVHFKFEVISDTATADGSYSIYLEFSNSDGGWPSDSDGFVLEEDLIFLKSMNVASSEVDESRSVNFEI